MKSLWIAYCRITSHKNKSSKAAGHKETSPEEVNYEYVLQCAENNDNQAFKNGVVRTQSKAKSCNDVDIVCKAEVKRKWTTGIKNEILEIDVYDCEIYKEADESKNDILLGTITTNISSIEKDIEKIALMGSGITKSEFKTIAKSIEVNYPLIRPDTNNWKQTQVKSMEKALGDSIPCLYGIYRDYLNSGDKNNKEYGTSGSLFLIHVNEFNRLYNDMEISEYLSIKDYKKYLKDNVYIKTNQNRYDYTDAKLGKCIALEIKKLENKE